MLCHRMKQFREYNGISKDILAEVLGITVDKYDLFENGYEEPTIEIVQALARCYKVTVNEFYGYTPRLTLHSENDFDNDSVTDTTLQMSNLSWDEMQLILHYRKNGPDDDIIRSILEANK